MPTFRSRRPRSLSQSFAAILSSSPDLSESDAIEVERRALQANREEALGEKARLEAEELRKAAAFREGPGGDEYASLHSGAPVSLVTQLRRHLLSQADADPETGEMVPVGRPDLAPEQESLARAALAAAHGRRFTGSGNVEQLAGGASRGFSDIIRSRIAGTADAAERVPLKDALAPQRHSYGNVDARGIVSNLDTGQATVADRPIYDAAVQATQALSGQRDAAAERSRRQPAPRQPAPPKVRDPALVRRDNAYADVAEERARKAREERARESQSKARREFSRDPKMRGMELGKWVEGKGFEVIRGGKVIGHYD